ncbi:hypothetical protein MGMO_8c00380 [Methyloglobulus morosus KoM1]|uniref:DUF2760 domain-containing protein n=1 Tax=Methyloglobulus morosus KoM1 TaxID=1116472 RepID=V5E2W8_9GAMM|nr:DUF2760 domain-containing protein [Methyloglobulus morosus]ESS73901.1 hypothetical protein MGMO_8c00380 [Methyloglobulus morosus KoM1]
MTYIESLMSTFSVDLTLRPTTFDLWHVCLAGTVVALMAVIILLLLLLLFSRSMNKTVAEPATVQPIHAQPAEPTVKIIEKIIEVEKIVPAPTPEPVVLKEYTPDAALQVLGLLQKEARFIDFIKEDITAYSDADIGVAARVVHDGCNKALNAHFSLAPIRTEQEGSNITVPVGFDATAIRLTGNIVGAAPFTGSLVHKGWQVTEVRLPKLTQGHNPHIVAAAEIEL